MPAEALPRVLVIKLGALGDVVQALGPFAAIRRNHPGAHVTLLTTAPYKAFLAASGWFDEIWIDDRPPPWRADRCDEILQRVARHQLFSKLSRLFDEGMRLLARAVEDGDRRRVLGDVESEVAAHRAKADETDFRIRHDVFSRKA